MDDRKIAEVSLAYVSNNHNKNITGMRDPRRQFIRTNNAWLQKIKSLLFVRPDIFGKRLMWRDKLIVSCSCCNILLFGGKASTPDTLHVECSDICKKRLLQYNGCFVIRQSKSQLRCLNRQSCVC